MLKKHWIAISLAFSTVILYLFFLRGLPVASIATDSVERNTISATPSLDRGIIVREEKGDVLRDPYVPPMVRTPPLFIQTDYSQVGILTSDGVNSGFASSVHPPLSGAGGSQGGLPPPCILPLFGRRMRRDKWQYYTISNTGTLNTKLPIHINGKSATGEYGCDPIVSNDTVFVEGYKEMMSATIYENNQFSYNPDFLI